MDESVIEITPEERERIIANIKSNCVKSNCALFVGAQVAKAIQANYDNDKESWDKLLALIESAPAKKNMRAIELANKLEESYDSTGNVFTTLCDVLGYESTGITTEKDMKNLCEAIRNLDASEDGIPWPLDRDGVPIKLGDTVYLDNGQYKVIEIQYHDFDCDDIHITVRTKKEDSILFYAYSPKYLSHKKPRTLDDIISDIMYSTEDGACDDLEEEVNARVHEAYEIGRRDGANDAKA